MNKTFLWATTLAGTLCAGGAQALEFGAARVQSYLNQPLEVRIPLRALSADERDGLDVVIASPALFQRFHVRRSAEVDALDVKLRGHGSSDSAVIVVRSRGPVREPFIRFLIEARSGSRRALRAYTVMLDPAPSAPRWVSKHADRSPVAEAAPSTPQPASKPVATARRRAVRAGREYGPVRDGETLWSIAEALDVEDSTTDQAALAVYRANPDAFGGGGPGDLLRGAMLAIPGAERIAAVDAGAARRRIRSAPRLVDRTSAAARDEPRAVLGEVKPSGETTAPPTRTASAQSNRIAAAPATFERRDHEVATPASSFEAALPSRPSVRFRTRLTSLRLAGAVPAGTVTIDAPPAIAARRDGSTSTPATTPTAEAKVPSSPGDAIVRLNDNDVAAAGEGGVLAPRNLVLALLLGLGALVFRRLRARARRPVPVDAEFERSDSASAAAIGAFRVRSAAPPATDAPGRACSALRSARAHLAAGQFSQARAVLESARVDGGRDIGLQHALLEVAYRAGDAVRFSEEFDRFAATLRLDSERYLETRARGRALLPGDARFAAADGEDDGNSENHDSFAAPAPSVEMPRPNAIETERQSATETAIVTAATDAIPSRRASDKPARPPHTAASNAPAPGAPAALELPTESPAPAPTRDAPSERDAPIDLDDAYLWTRGSADSDTSDFTEAKAEANADADAGDESDEEIALEHARPATAARAEVPETDDRESAFELDLSGETDIEPRPIDPGDDDNAPRTAADTSAIEMIDAGDYDLGADAAEDTDDTPDADTLDMRLELARMYKDMDDRDMARGLLEEVLAGGNAEQRDSAQALLGELDAQPDSA